MADDELTPAERAEIDSVLGVLTGPAVWAEPPAGLQESVVAAIAREAAVSRRRRWVRYVGGAAAAAVLLAVSLTVGLRLTADHPVRFEAALAHTDLAADASGDVTLTKTVSGWRIELHATGLPRRADGSFYEAWLKNDAGVLVPIGTFNDGRKVVLWSGVGPADYPTLTVTREVADGNQASSGEVVLVARPHRS